MLGLLVVVPASATSQSLVPACSGVNIRTATSTSSTVAVKLNSGIVTVSGTVSGGSWSTLCPTSKSGSSWYTVTHVNGETVQARFGAAVLYAATGVLTAPPAPVATPAPAVPPAPTTAPVATTAPASTPPPTTAPSANPAAGTAMVPACDGINLRTGTSTSHSIKVRLGINNAVTTAGTVAGSSWSTVCPTSKSGSSWYKVSHVNGQPVSSLYGVTVLYAAAGVLTAPVTTASTGLTTLGASTTFFGRGYGHGVGMSQYGARGRALAGQTAAEILAHYYATTVIGTISPETSIRVLVLDNFVPTLTTPLTIHGRGGPWTVTGLNLELPADARLRIVPGPTTGAWRAIVDTALGQVLFDGPVGPDLRVAGTAEPTTIQLSSKSSAYDLYRGTLRVLATSTTVDVVNELPLEAYLRGVVPAEMPSSWPLEARVAQTIVARSYAAAHLHPTTGTFDVFDDTRSQVYGGVRRETAATDAVVAATAGQVLHSGSSIANTLFHSTGGGATEHNENVFVSSTGAKVAGPVAYLRGSSDRDPAGIAYDAGAPLATWQTKAYALADLSAIFAKDSRTNVGTLVALDLRNRGVSGRLISVTLVGSGGTRTVSGAVFIAAFNTNRPVGDPYLRSTLVDVAPIL